jgi:oligoribonuclease (3'-5' exoribonuclease)
MSDLLSKKYIVWVDLEMTGLNIDKDTIIQVNKVLLRELF